MSAENEVDLFGIVLDEVADSRAWRVVDCPGHPAVGGR
jgi:hypothetical protein